MPQFHYSAINADGQSVTGQITADDAKAALVLLETGGLTVQSIQQLAEESAQQDSSDAPFAAETATRPPDDAQRSRRPELRQLESQLARVLALGKPLAPALVAYAAEMPRGKYRRELEQIAAQLAEGGPPADVFGAGGIPEQWIPLLGASAATSDARQILNGFITVSRRVHDTNRRIVLAFAYPLVLTVIALGVLAGLCIFIVPTFKSIFMDFGVALPAPTEIVIELSDIFVQSHGFAFLAPLLLIVVGLLAFRFAVPPVVRQTVMDWIPLVGRVRRLSSLAQFAQHLAALLEAQIPTTQSLRIASRISQRRSLRLAALRLAEFMEAGGTSLRESPDSTQLPATVLHALQLDNSTAAASSVLKEVSCMYDAQAHDDASWIGSLTEPLFILVMGGMVGFVVIALLLPLVSLIANLS